MAEDFRKTEVVTRNAIIDWLEMFRNLLGWNLKSYEEMIQDTADRLMQDAKEEGEIDWWRYEVNPITQASAIIVIYGEYE